MVLVYKKAVTFVTLGVFGVVVLILSCNLGIYLATRDRVYNDVASAPFADVVLIPGAAVTRKGELSPIFIDRVETAAQLYEAKKVKKILVSGNNSSPHYNEVSPVRTYLLSRGIPEADIFLDHAGFDTYSTMYRARDVFGVSTVLIATQSFHLPRSVFIARQLGLEAAGVRADAGYILKRNYARELLANVNALLELSLARKPKFLGEPVLIMGEEQTI